MAGLNIRGQARDMAASQREPGANHEYTPLLQAEQGEAAPGGEQPTTPVDAAFINRGVPSSAQGTPAVLSPFVERSSTGRSIVGTPGNQASLGNMPNNGISGPDIVQFSSMIFYVVEGEGSVAVTAMRIGSLMSPCSVSFQTEDNSAKAGAKYKEAKGTIDFQPGEEMKVVEVKILDDDSFDTNLDFRLAMVEPAGCQLSEMSSCRIVIIDNDVFPSNKYREQILKEEAQQFGVRLLIAFIRFSMDRIPNVKWRTGWNLLLDQFSNLNYLWAIYLNVYLVDVVFAVHNPDSGARLWVKHQRLWTAVLVAVGFLVPRALQAWIEWSQMTSLAVAGRIKLHLKVNLFRKYLYYSPSSHVKVKGQELTKAMEGDINELVMYGYETLFQIAQQSVKVCVILGFLVHKRPSTALPMLVYPIAMAMVLNLRYEQTLILKDRLRDSEKSTMTCLRESCDDINLIKNYNMRTAVVARFEKSIEGQKPHQLGYNKYDFRTLLVMPWITNLAIASFMILGGHFVLTDQLSLGAFLATISIYRDSGELFTGFYEHLKDFYGVIGPLLRVVRLLNLETDVIMSMQQTQERRNGMLAELRSEEKMRKQFQLSPRATSRFDMLHIKFLHTSLSNDRGGPNQPSLQDISVEVPQGKMVAVLGPHGTGKRSLLRILSGLCKANKGEVHVPTHLRCLYVPNHYEIFKNGNLLENLSFGTKGNFNKERLVKLCKAVGLGAHTMKLMADEIKQNAEEKAKEISFEDDRVPWYEQMSQSELLKMHIVRALNLNPEVLCLHRPVDEMEADHAARLMDVLRQFVDHRGLFLSPDQRAAARPHTVFFTSGEDRERADSAKDVSDVIWHLSDKGFSVEPGGRMPSGGPSGPDNKIVNSWSREARSLQVNLEKEKHLHSATLGELENHRNELENTRGETEYLRGTLNDVTSQAKRALRDAKTYEQELMAWEGEQKKSNWLPCVQRDGAPVPRQLSQTLGQMVTSGETRRDQRSRNQSPPPYTHGPAAQGVPPISQQSLQSS